MAIAVALFSFCFIFFLGGVNPALAAPGTVLLVVTAIGMVGLAAYKGGASPQWNALDTTVCLFVAYAITRYWISALEREARLELIQVLVTFVAYMIAAKGMTNKSDRRVFIWLLAAFALFQSGLGIWQAFSRSDFIFWWERPELYNGRGSGTYVCPNHLAGFLEMSLGLISARAAVVRRESKSTERSVLIKFLLIYVAAMVVVGIIVTLSRAGWVSAVSLIFVIAVFGGWHFRRAFLRLAILAIVLAFGIGILWSLDPVRNYLSKSITVGNGNIPLALSDPTMGGRTLMWRGTIDIIKETPVLGTGLGSWKWVHQKHKDFRILSFPEYTHNDYLNLASDYGLVGVSLMLPVFISFLMRALRVCKHSESSEDRAIAVGALAAVTAILVHSWFDFNLHIPANSVFLGVILGLVSSVTPRKSRGLNSASTFSHWTERGIIVLACSYVLYLFIPTFRAFRICDQADVEKYDLQYHQAVATYHRSLEIDPNYSRPWIRIGDIHRDQVAWRIGPSKVRERRELAAKAVAAYDRALELNPYLTDVLVGKGRVLEQAGDLEDALQSYRKAIDVAPVSAYAHFALGQFYRARGRSEEAVDEFTKANKYFLYNDPMFQLSEWYERESLKSRRDGVKPASSNAEPRSRPVE